MSVSINGTGGITFADASTQSTGGYTGFRNRIINGAMMIDQRNAGASVTPSDFAYTLDRWQARQSTASKFSIQQSSVAPVGFTNSLLVTSLSAYSVSSSDVMSVRTQIEGFNVSDFGWGTASAATVTLSFWVRSSLTGTFGGSLVNINNDRSYPFSYTISSASTWEQKSITIAGDTTGTWNITNGRGISLSFGLGVGSTSSGTAGSWQAANLISATGATSVVGTSGATFYITGVQLEKGSVATPFEFRPYGQELALCQRYFEVLMTGASGDANRPLAAAWSASDTNVLIPFKITKRASAAVAVSGGQLYTGSWNNLSSISVIGANDTATTVNANLNSSLTAQRVYFMRNADITASAEL